MLNLFIYLKLCILAHRSSYLLVFYISEMIVDLFNTSIVTL